MDGYLVFLVVLVCVRDTVSSPYIKVSKTKVQLDYYSNDEITCQTYGSRSKIIWLKRITGGLEKVKTEVDRERTKQGKMLLTRKLIIRNATVSHRGRYVCQVSNGGSVAQRDVRVLVKDPKTPEIRRFNKERVEENEKASLYCKSKGAPEPTIKFFKDGREITSTTKGYTITNNGKRLTVLSAQFPEHNGVYSCNVTNMFGRASATAQIVVTVPPSLEKKRTVILVGDREKLKATCNVINSNPVPTMTWQYQPWPCLTEAYNCTPMESKWKAPDPVYVQPSGRNATMWSTFTVPKSKVKRFFIRCTARHPYGEDSHVMAAIIDKRDAREFLKTSPKNKKADEEESFTLICIGKAGLFNNLTWFKDSRRVLPDGTSISIVNRGADFEEKLSNLTITRARLTHSGNYTCVANLIKSGGEPISALLPVIISKIHPAKVISLKTDAVMDGKRAVLTCAVSGHPAVAVQWYKDDIPLDDKITTLSNIEDCKSAAIGSYFKINKGVGNNGALEYHELVICRSTWKKNNGTYTCKVSNRLGTDLKVKSQFINARPQLTKTQHEIKYLHPGSGFSANCSAEGNPTPFVWWERRTDNNRYIVVTQNSTNGISWLNIASIKTFGEYRCVARNPFGNDFQTIELQRTPMQVSRDKDTTTAYLLVIIVAAGIMLIIITALTIIMYKRKKLYGGFYILSIPPLPDYLKTLDSSRSVLEQVHKLPYFPEWEFPRENVQMKNRVGSGQFGEVYIADVQGIVDFDPHHKLALKHRPLLSKERFHFNCIFVKEEKKKNVVKKSTVVKEERKKVIRNGSMDSVKSHKSRKGKDKSVLVAVKKLKEDASGEEYKDLISEMKMLIHIGRQDNIVNLLAACTKGLEKDTLVILEYCKHGDLLSFMKGRRQIFKPIWSKQHVGMEDEFTTFDLCVAAYQISKGLEFLASRRCVHRDVAARNVLVGANYVMKVADFGLARDIYHDQAYVKQTGGLLPLKWMAIESIIDRVFTHQSDVWAYGVLLWELMTLGGSPYPGINHQYLPEYLHEGNRMDQPQFCPNEIYLLMRDCWEMMPDVRPTFSDIVLRLAGVIESHCTDPEMLNCYLEKSHIGGGDVSQSDDYIKPIDGAPLGSYKFSPPPTYSQSFEDRRLGNDHDGGERDVLLQRMISDRYVPEKRFVENNVEEESLLGGNVDEVKFEGMDDDGDQQAYINDQPSYVNDLPSTNDHRVLITDNDGNNDIGISHTNSHTDIDDNHNNNYTNDNFVNVGDRADKSPQIESGDASYVNSEV